MKQRGESVNSQLRPCVSPLSTINPSDIFVEEGSGVWSTLLTSVMHKKVGPVKAHFAC